MQQQAQDLANAFSKSGRLKERFSFTSGTDAIVIIVVRAKTNKDKDTMERINESVQKRIDGQEISFLPAGGCPCCGK
jgi:hypothetical protein